MSVREFEFPGVDQVVIDNLGAGSIVVDADPEPGRVQGSLEASDEGFLAATHIRQERDVLRISLSQSFWRGEAAHLRLQVPGGLRYVVKTGSADVSIAADMGRSKIATGSGDINVGRASDLDCSTGSGNISVDTLTGSGARLNTGSGEISIGTASCPLSAKSASGDVTIKSLHGADLRASTASGDVSVSSTTGSVDVRAASGSLSVGVADDLPAWLDLSSISGNVRVGLEATSRPEPREPYVTIRARTASGEISVFRA